MNLFYIYILYLLIPVSEGRRPQTKFCVQQRMTVVRMPAGFVQTLWKAEDLTERANR